MVQKNRYLKWGLTAFCTVAAILLFYDTLFGSHALLEFLQKFVQALQPVLYGAFMAYLLAPVVDFFEKGVAPTRRERVQKKKKLPFFVVRSASILLTWAVIAVLLYLLGSVLLPELYSSVMQLFSNIETYYNTISEWVQHLFDANPQLEAWVGMQMETAFGTFESWLATKALPQAQNVMIAVTGGVISVVTFLSDLLVGVIVSVYFLATKERCSAHSRKRVYSLFPEDKVSWIMRGTRKADSIFSGFVRGKLLDSLIIGILCFIGCSILRFPYTPLVSVIVGVTNVIPFFGPFLGAIPSIFLILLVSPLQAVYFALFVLALQQLDGNVIGPKILGDKTGLSSLWVIVAILVGGSFFGFIGMFFGVPVCACLYSLVTFLVERRLENKQMPVETEAYATAEVVLTENEAKTPAKTEENV